MTGRTITVYRSAQEPYNNTDVGPLAQESTESGQRGLRGTLKSHADDRETSSLGLRNGTADEENQTHGLSV